MVVQRFAGQGVKEDAVEMKWREGGYTSKLGKRKIAVQVLGDVVPNAIDAQGVNPFAAP